MVVVYAENSTSIAGYTCKKSDKGYFFIELSVHLHWTVFNLSATYSGVGCSWFVYLQVSPCYLLAFLAAEIRADLSFGL